MINKSRYILNRNILINKTINSKIPTLIYTISSLKDVRDIVYNFTKVVNMDVSMTR